MFKIYVADNYHNMDPDEVYIAGEYATWSEAVEVAKGIVDRFLKDDYQPGQTAQELYARYRAFGDDPQICPVPEGESFSAWKYANTRADSLVKELGGG